MAPTKANTTYAVTTLSLLTKGPVQVIAETSLVHLAARLTRIVSKTFRPEKVSATVTRHFSTAGGVVKES
jgi:hypothetical protein